MVAGLIAATQRTGACFWLTEANRFSPRRLPAADRQGRLGAARRSGRRRAARLAGERWSPISPARAQAGQQVAVVSSGAIALGARRLGLPKGGRASLEDAQAAAATGQIALSQVWAELLRRAGHDRRADARDARRSRGSAPLSQRLRDARPAARRWAWCRSSTRMTASRPRKSASATMTGSPRASAQAAGARGRDPAVRYRRAVRPPTRIATPTPS